MNIYEVVWDFPPNISGGLAVFTYQLSCRLSSLGHNITVITRKINNYESFDQNCNFKIVRMGESSRPTNITKKELNLFNDLASRYIEKNKNNIDILHLQDWSSIGLARKFKKYNFKVISTIHSISGVCYENVPEYVVSNAPYADIITTVSNSMKQKLFEMGLNNLDISTIYNGVDIDKYTLHECTKGKKILFIGRLEKIKGILELIKAMKIVVDMDKDITLTICGNGSLNNEINSLINDYNLRDNVKYLGFVSESDKIKLLNTSVGVVLPSKYEPFGLVVLETLACNKPIIITPFGGPKEIIGNHGIILKSIEPEEIANKILFLFENINNKNYGCGGRDYVKNNFNWDSTTSKFIQLFEFNSPQFVAVGNTLTFQESTYPRRELNSAYQD